MPDIILRDGARVASDGHQFYAQIDNNRVILDGGIAQSLRTGVVDADGAFFFQRQLEAIKARSYDVRYADLQARTLFPVSNEGGAGVTSIVYRTYDQVGVAKIINSYAADLPRADVAGIETRIPVRSVASSYGYNIDEINAATLTGEPLDQRRSNASRRAVEQSINGIAFFGDAEFGLPGLFNNPNIPIGPVVNPGGGTAFVDKTPSQVLFDINDLFNDVFQLTKMGERANTLLLPPEQWGYIVSTPRSDGSDMTIAQYVANNSPYLNSVADIIPVNECAAENNPDFADDIMVAYDRNPDKLQLEIPLEMEYSPVQQRNLEFVIPGRARVAGLNIYYPLSLSIATGI